MISFVCDEPQQRQDPYESTEFVLMDERTPIEPPPALATMVTANGGELSEEEFTASLLAAEKGQHNRETLRAIAVAILEAAFDSARIEIHQS